MWKFDTAYKAAISKLPTFYALVKRQSARLRQMAMPGITPVTMYTWLWCWCIVEASVTQVKDIFKHLPLDMSLLTSRAKPSKPYITKVKVETEIYNCNFSSSNRSLGIVNLNLPGSYVKVWSVVRADFFFFPLFDQFLQIPQLWRMNFFSFWMLWYHRTASFLQIMQYFTLSTTTPPTTNKIQPSKQTKTQQENPMVSHLIIIPECPQSFWTSHYLGFRLCWT